MSSFVRLPREPGAPQVPRRPGPAAGRLDAVDGLRAVAALWVVLFHIWAFSGVTLWPGVDLLARSGSTGVSLFLVLSGFCLYLPVAQGKPFRMGAFLRRRCGRLLPAYYVSLLVLVLAHLFAGGHVGLSRLTGRGLVAQVTTHLTLTHQLFPSTFYGLNGAYWSLGLEWELYLTLPLLVLGVRRWGLAATVTGVFAVTVGYRLVLQLLVARHVVDPGGTWADVVLPNLFLGRWSEFGLGMLAAARFSSGRLPVVGPRLGVAALASGALAMGLPDNPFKHMLFGVVFFALLCAVLDGDNRVARAFARPPLVAVGVMSYSLYLVHQPIVESLAAVLGGPNGRTPATVFLLLVLLVPVLLAVAWLLFVTVERRSMGPAGVGRLSAGAVVRHRYRQRPKAGLAQGRS